MISEVNIMPDLVREVSAQEEHTEYEPKRFPEWMRSQLEGDLKFNERLRKFRTVTELARAFLAITPR